jgi:ABC-type phosphate transport system ATPase subunit
MLNTQKLENTIREQINLRHKYNNAKNRYNLSTIVNKCSNSLNLHMNNLIQLKQTFSLILGCGQQLLNSIHRSKRL